MALSSKNNLSIRFKAIVVAFLIFDLFLLYFFKYSNQKISISEFSLSNIGNIINLIETLVLIFLFLIVSKSLLNAKGKNIVLTLLILIQLFLVTAFLSAKFYLPFHKIYMFGQNGNRLFTGLLYTLFQFCFFYLFIYLLHILVKTKNLVLLRAAVHTSFMMLFFLAVSFFFIVAKENNLSDNIDNKFNKNIAVVFGAAVWSDNKPSPSLAGRVDAAIKLLINKKVNSIYLTGGNAPGELSESEVAYKYLLEKNIDHSNVYTENSTSSTNEQIQFIKKLLQTSEKNKNIIAVSDPYHLVRIQEISKFHHINISVMPSELNFSFEKALYFKIREALALTVFWFFAL